MIDTAAPQLSGFAFARTALDRADALRDETDTLMRLWPEAQVLVLDEAGAAVSDAQGGRIALTGKVLGNGVEQACFLGKLHGQAWFAIGIDAVACSDSHRIGLREAAARWSEDDSSLFAFARSMLFWQRRNRYCGACGGVTRLKRAGFVAECNDCGIHHYPRVDPAVIVAVSDGARLLLGRHPNWPDSRYSLVAGFVEPGETPEQAVIREVWEETRIRVQQCRYLAAQPWPFPSALMMGFIAQAYADSPHVNGELADARWFDCTEIGRALGKENGATDLQLSPSISIARALIEYWYETYRAAQ